MITVAGTDKELSDMTTDELSVMIAKYKHLISRRRYSNRAHLSYLKSRLETCRLELALRQ